MEQKIKMLGCLVIDDPLVRFRYGYLDYRKLHEATKEYGLHTSTAIIPWNYLRNDKEAVDFFKENEKYFSFSVHGCNHTNNEFGSDSYKELKCLANTALWRMEQFKKNTGLAYDPVMVFPQGSFSSTAMKVLNDTGYLAAFNSKLVTINGIRPPQVEFDKSFTQYFSGFPLFIRRPIDEKLFLKNVECNQPIVIVAHHDDFSMGYGSLVRLLKHLNGMVDIKWTSLMNIAVHYCGGKNVNINCFNNNVPPDKKLKIVVRRFLSEVRDNYLIVNKLYKLLLKSH